jgi:hypothetical protein
VVRSGVAAALVVALAACGGDGRDGTEARQDEVAERGALVMPFDLERTTHVFDPTPTGGVQTVVADDPTDEEQVVLVREHLAEEAERFRAGDFGDPAAIHGHDMPGLAELEAGYAGIGVAYADVDDGARIVYETDDPALVNALHDWFEAQVSDHGEHADHATCRRTCVGEPPDEEEFSAGRSGVA